jgi:hypothetical protein
MLCHKLIIQQKPGQSGRALSSVFAFCYDVSPPYVFLLP